MDQLYHVTTENNPADLPTRPSLVQESDVGPMSTWEKGLPWMRYAVEDAIESGILTPVSKLRLSDREVEDFNKGFIYEKTKDILTKGHVTVLATARVENVLSRAQFSNYLIPLNKYKFEKTVKVLAIMLKFINMKTKGKFSEKMKCGIKFQAFSVTLVDDDKVPKECKSLLDLLKASDPFIGIKKARDPFIGISFGCKDPDVKFIGKHQVLLTEEDISRCLYYLFEKAIQLS